ncbi:MAG TPA: glycogen debranching N-terminal domain-containing protein [Thermoanaerobaculia bacterium]|nr:glycogen debranching N-terminal domain-containing protein [Thermoanaerobaculia bacterium]
MRTEHRHAWCGPSLLAMDAEAWCGGGTFSGYFFREARHLSVLRLELFDEDPELGSIAEGPQTIEASFLYPPVETRGGGGSGSGGATLRHGLLARGVDLSACWRVRPASLTVRVRIAVRAHDEVEVPVAWRLAADFADLQQAAAGHGGFDARVEASDGAVVLGCEHPELPLSTRVVAGGADWRWSGDRLEAVLILRRQEPVDLVLDVRAIDDADPITETGEDEREERLAQWRAGAARLIAPGGDAFVELADSALEDLGSLALLDGPRQEWLAPAAGIPYYPAFFARDSITAAWQAACLDGGELLAAAQAKAVRLIGRREDPWRDEQPGRLVQQARRGPLARLDENPFGRYYGDYASPLMFVISLGQSFAWTGDRRALRDRWPAAMAVLEWARRHGDSDGDGYLEYLTRSPQGPRHQGWKDSDNAVVDERGEQVEPPFASCELQGYWYAALQVAAVLAAILGRWRAARRLWREASELESRFNRDFWLDDEGMLAFGLDADMLPVRTLTSNVGHCLASGIVARRHIPRLVDRLFSPELFSGWGIRTLSADNPAYNPFDYHLGTVWPVENSTILFGLRRYGLDDRVLELASALWELGRLWGRGRIPECVGGLDRDEWGHPGCYPHSNVPQAWNQSAWPLLVQSLLGLQPLAPLHVLAVSPLLPDWLPELEVRGLRVGRAEVDLRFWRNRKGRGRFRVLRRRGRLRVIRQPPLDDLGTGLAGRLLALLSRS